MTLSIASNPMANRAANTFAGHYQQLLQSTRRLSTGLRINGAADDAAGLAVREIMRAEIAATRQGVRNVNDAISMIQTADGALAVINEKLIRLKELAEQAATGTYSQAQREIMDQEFQAMKAEIDRIANSTMFNGLRLLNADRSATIHFGPENRTGLDEYAVELEDATLIGLGLEGNLSDIPNLNEILVNGAGMQQFPSSVVTFARIPAGSENIDIHLFSHDDPPSSFQIFTADGEHVAGTVLDANVWVTPDGSGGVTVDPANVNDLIVTEANGFNAGATYNGTSLNGTGADVSYTPPFPPHNFVHNGMSIDYSGNAVPPDRDEYLSLNRATEDLLIIVIGQGEFSIRASWDAMPASAPATNLLTQEDAQQALDTISDAILTKDTLRARLGASQNRLENTGRVMTITTENLHAAESRISDIDMAREATRLLSSQIKSQAAIAMLAQANILPQMTLELLNG